MNLPSSDPPHPPARDARTGAAPRVRGRRGAWVAVATLAGLALLVAAFDWDWCRPLLKHYVESHSGRRFDCARLEVRFEPSGDPTITLHDVRIDNARWASARMPFLQARRVSATIAWRSLSQAVTVLPLVVLEDAQVDMERQADGLRNWRLGHPDDRGPPRVRLLALDARNSRLHVMHGGVGLVADAQSTPLPAPQALAGHADLPLTRRLRFRGTLGARSFEGDVQVSDLLAFGATPPSDHLVALRGSARLEGWRLDAEGVTDDVHALGDLDLDTRLARDPTVSSPWPLPDALARLRPLAAQAHVTRHGDTWTASALRVTAGRGTRMDGEASFSGHLPADAPRGHVQATVREAVIDVDDLSVLRGRSPAGESATQPGLRSDQDHAWSDAPLALARLRALDANVVVLHARLSGAGRDLAQSLRGRAELAQGVLQVRDLDIGLAGGHVTGSLRLDASREPARLSLDAALRGLRLDALSSTLAGNGGLVGTLDGRAVIATQGDSPRALVANANGRANVALAPGATVSRRLDAKLGLDGGAWLRSLFDKSGRVPVECARLELGIVRGIATSRGFVFETADTALAGQGSADLAGQTLDLTLTPAHRRLALLALDKSIHVEGSWHAAKVSLRKAGDMPPDRCGPGA